MKNKASFYAPIFFGVVLVLVGFSYKLTEIIEKFAQDSILSTSIIQIAVFLLPLAFYCRIVGINYVSSMKFNLFPANRISFCAIMFLLYFFGSLFLKYLGITFFDGAMTDVPSAIPIIDGSGNTVLTILVFMVMPALFEEILFRGILLSEYREYSDFIAVLVTSIMYAMVHTSLKNFFYYLFAGMIFGFLTVVTKSIVPALILHFFANASYFFMGKKITEYIRQTGKSALLPFIMVSVILLLLFFMFSSLEGIYKDAAFNEFLQSRKELLRKASEGDKPESEKKPLISEIKDTVFSPTFVAVTAVYILLSANLF